MNIQSKLLGWLPDPEDDESGQGMVEYAFILVLIALVIIVILIILGNQVKNVYSNISAGIGA
jgi:pilus assembly protein Flp/PilA